MNDNQKKFYDDVVNGIVSEVDRVHISTANLLSMVCRLRQATVLPQILTSNELIESSKINRCVELVEQIISNGNKVVIFSTFKEPLRYLHNVFQDSLLCSGDVKQDIINDNILKFQTNEKYKILLCTPWKMGTGVTLNAAEYMIFLDSTYTRAQNLQCEDRIHRVNNTKPVFIYYLWANDSIDNRIKELVDKKSDLSNYIIDDEKNDDLINRLRKIVEDLKDGV